MNSTTSSSGRPRIGWSGVATGHTSQLRLLSSAALNASASYHAPDQGCQGQPEVIQAASNNRLNMAYCAEVFVEDLLIGAVGLDLGQPLVPAGSAAPGCPWRPRCQSRYRSTCVGHWRPTTAYSLCCLEPVGGNRGIGKHAVGAAVHHVEEGALVAGVGHGQQTLAHPVVHQIGLVGGAVLHADGLVHQVFRPLEGVLLGDEDGEFS